ncbi:MAG: hypothetical protein IPM24_25220 [Bryobacterales bacterium]|nr:hypothetical protein [Bryobacterales bacterium]
MFFFVSGGVDSTVAYTLCLRALGAERVRGVYVDTGLMREGETDFVRHTFDSLHAEGTLAIEMACEEFRARAQARATPSRSGTSSASSLSRCRNGSSKRATCWTATVLGQEQSIPIRSNPAARPRRPRSRRTTIGVAGIQKLLEEGRVVETPGAVLQG